MPSRPGPRAAHRADVTAQIVAIGRRHLTEHGAAGLSLRAVTRELGMVSSAVYRYVANRDELLTVLLIDAYIELGDEVAASLAAARDASWRERFLAGARTLREWALREPARYALLYGSPVPGYAAPPERTSGPGQRVIGLFLALVAEGAAAGELAPGASGIPLPAALRADLVTVVDGLGLTLSPEVMGRVVGLWSLLFGAVSNEVFGHFGPDAFGERALLFDHQIDVGLRLLAGGV